MVDSQILKVIQNSIEAWKDLAVPSIQKITDIESNKKHYNVSTTVQDTDTDHSNSQTHARRFMKT